MRIAIYGTGGAGGYFGARLAQAGEEVVFLARGEHLRAIRERGLRVETPEGEFVVHPARAEEDPARVGVVDVVIFGVKTWQLPEVARAAAPMVGPGTLVVPLQNGVDAPVELAAALGEEHVLGGTCGTISRVVEPGFVRSLGAINFVKFGELDGRPSERTDRLRRAFEAAGVTAEVPASIHAAMWEKFLFVVPYGGVGAVTRAPAGVVRALPETRRMLEAAMQEIFEVAEARGIGLARDIVGRSMELVDALAPGGTTSLQRDVTSGRRTELEAWNGAVVRLGREAGVATPLNAFLYHSLLPLELRARGELAFPESA
jgi:2-dehydropantoate 2-reductase